MLSKLFNKLTLIFFLFPLVLFSEVLEKENYKYFSHFSTDEGLSDLTVKCFYRDDTGLLWIGTRNGLNSYNGSEISFCTNKGQVDSLSLNPIECIQKYGDKLLIGGLNFGLCIYDPNNKSFEPFNHPEVKTYEIGNVFSIEYDTDSNLWVGSSIKGVIKIDKHTNKVMVLDVPPSSWPRKIFIRKNGDVWISTWKSGVFVYSKHNSKLNNLTFNALGASPVMDFAEDKYGKLFLATWGKGLIRINKILGNEVLLWEDLNNRFMMHSRHFTDIELLGGVTIIAASKNGIFYLERTSDSPENAFVFDASYKNFANPNPLVSAKVLSIYYDKEDILWIGTDGFGINKLNYTQNFVSNYVRFTPKKSFGRLKFIEPLLNNAFVFTAQGGSWICDMDDKEINSVASHKLTNAISKLCGFKFNGLDYLNTVSINNSNWYILNAPYKPIFIVREDLKAFVKFDIIGSGFGNVTSAITDDYGNIWLASNWETTLLKFNNTDNKVDRSDFYHFDKNYFDGLFKSHVYKIFKDNDGDLWFLLRNNGVVCITKQQLLNIGSLKRTDLIKTSVGNFMAHDVKQLNDSVLIFGTYGNGLAFYNKKENSVRLVAENEGFTAKSINTIQVDSNNEIWLGTEQGVYRLTMSDSSLVHTLHLTQHDGLRENYCTSSMLLPNGNLLFGSLDGFSVINPLLWNKNNYIPNVQIIDLEVFSRTKKNFKEPINFGTLPRSNDGRNILELPYSKYAFKFKMSALSFQNPENNFYAYRLQNFNDEWTKTDANDRTVYYQNLPPGIYQLQIKVSNNNMVWSDVCECFTVKVLPPFWQTLMFKILLLMAIISLVLYLVYLRNKKLVFKNTELQKIVDDKTGQLVSKNNKLQEVINSKNRFISLLSHDLKNPIAASYGLAEVMVEQGDLLEKEEKNQFARSIKDSLGYTLNLLENLVAWGKTTISVEQSYSKELIELKVLVNRLLDHHLENNKLVRIINNVAEGIWVETNVNMTNAILRNLLNNAEKFSKVGGIIEIHGEIDKDKVWVSVKDNGVGMSPKKANELFNIEKVTSTEGTLGEKGSGLGLIMVSDFVKRMGGDIDIESVLGSGTTVKFSLQADASKQ